MVLILFVVTAILFTKSRYNTLYGWVSYHKKMTTLVVEVAQYKIWDRQADGRTQVPAPILGYQNCVPIHFSDLKNMYPIRFLEMDLVHVFEIQETDRYTVLRSKKWFRYTILRS